MGFVLMMFGCAGDAALVFHGGLTQNAPAALKGCATSVAGKTSG